MKGISKTLEAVIASSLLVITVLTLVTLPMIQPAYEKINWKLIAFNALSLLDSSGKLRKYALANDVASIENELASYLPGQVNYKVVIYANTNLTPIPKTRASDVVVVSYYISGEVGNFGAREIRVYIW